MTLDFATVSGCDQLVVGPTHVRGRILDLLMTDVPYLIQVAVVAPIANSDHSLLSEVISTAKAVPNLCVSRKVFLKHQVNWNSVYGAMRDLPWRNIWSSDNPVEVLNEHLSQLVGVMYQLRSSEYITRISLGSMIYADVLSSSSRRLIFGGPVIALGLIGRSLVAVTSELMKHTRRPSISLVSETSMFS